MSALFNQTNLAPGTSFSGSGSGGSSNFPNGILISQGGVDTNKIGIAVGELWGQNSLATQNSSGTDFSPLVSSRLIAKAGTLATPTAQKTGQYGADAIIFQGNNGSGNGCTFLSVNDANMSSGANDIPFAINGVSTITSAGNPCIFNTSNLAFTAPNGIIRLLPNANQMNCQNLAFTSTINALNTAGTGLAGAINMTDLTSTIKGYGWARVGAASP